MTEDIKKKCFTLFGNLKFKKEINQGGIGLGLASSSLLCNALGGWIELLESEEGQGSTFSFVIQVELGEEIDNYAVTPISVSNLEEEVEEEKMSLESNQDASYLQFYQLEQSLSQQEQIQELEKSLDVIESYNRIDTKFLKSETAKIEPSALSLMKKDNSSSSITSGISHSGSRKNLPEVRISSELVRIKT